MYTYEQDFYLHDFYQIYSNRIIVVLNLNVAQYESKSETGII